MAESEERLPGDRVPPEMTTSPATVPPPARVPLLLRSVPPPVFSVLLMIKVPSPVLVIVLPFKLRRLINSRLEPPCTRISVGLLILIAD